MKIFSAILMLLILAMNFKPCADEIVSNETSIDVVLKKTTDHQHEEKDDCSPFCNCACCSVRSLSEDKAETPLFLPEINTQTPNFVMAGPLQMSLTIWQPPQMA